MSYFSALIYGLIQGIAEFLPVSSSAHLALLPIVNNWKDPGVVFDLSMHIGTAFAVMIYFREEILELFVDGYSLIIKKQIKEKSYFFINLFISTMTTVIMVLILKDFALKFGRELKYIIFNLAFFGIIMYFSDRRKIDDNKDMNKLQYIDSILIGFFQSLAIFPGVSRSGITLTVSRFFCYSRAKAASFSFLLSLPIILASFLHEVPKLIHGDAFSVSISLPLCFFGVFISFIIGLATIHFFIKFISKIGLGVFAIYRVIFAIVLWKFFL